MAWVDLHSAAARGDLDQLRRHWCLKKFLINRRNPDKLTPLHLACINGHADVVRFLVGKSCKLNPRDKYKRSPLMLAVQHQHRDCVAILLEHGANLYHRAATGNTALHFAVLMSSKSLVELLLEYGADIDVKNELGYTPLTLAISERCKGMIEFLLQKGADVNATDTLKRTPLEVAAILQDKDAAEVLLRNGGVINKEGLGAFAVRDLERLFGDEFIANEGEEYECSERKGPCSAGGTEEINSSCSGTTADILSNTPALPESCKTLCYQGGVLPGVREEQKKDKDSSWDSETDSKGRGKVSADPTLPAAVGKSLDARSVALEHGKGALPAAEEQKEDSDSSWDSEVPTVEEAVRSCWINGFWAPFPLLLLLPHACTLDLDMPVLQTKCSTDSKGRGKVSADLTLPAAVGKSLDARSVAVEHGKGILPAAGVEQKEYFDPSSKNKVPILEADLQLRSDSSSQTDSQLDRQPLVRQLLEKPDEVLKKNSLAEPSLGAMKTHSKDLKEEKPLMQEKLERSEAKEPKEHHIQKECFAASLKSAPKEKEITTSRNLQGLPPSWNVSLPAAIGQLRERIYCLEVEYARLEATVQQQAQTIAMIEKFRQAQKTCKCSIIHRGARPKLP
ncbi:ankyrin repeat domain-containing protein 36A-like isoform X9 [Corapipo altera]|uniref:ankyrin repeat domain-containing protein 36A-like isoform X9 n=1 Tax=Corapipo altera TaxID=415028 RepID=UPI000FD693A8|nr:ankyrin repeat domain-containing protein 36A-like isoform X9 [Corapipo altera]